MNEGVPDKPSSEHEQTLAAQRAELRKKHWSALSDISAFWSVLGITSSTVITRVVRELRPEDADITTVRSKAQQTVYYSVPFQIRVGEALLNEHFLRGRKAKIQEAIALLRERQEKTEK